MKLHPQGIFPLMTISVLCMLLWAGCVLRGESQPTNQTPRQSLNVFAAASLADAFSEIARAFEGQHPGLEVVLNFAGSQQLAAQISQGAPADVFASANHGQMQRAITSGRIQAEAPTTFARNHLVVVVPTRNPSRIYTLADLSRSGLQLVIADAVVPAGQYTRKFLTQAASLHPDYSKLVLANVVSFEQSVRAVLTKVQLAEADAGVVYESDLSKTSAVTPLYIPDSLNATAMYPIAPLHNSPMDSLARVFVAFVQAPDGQAILKRHGFKAPEEE
ncbi:MAG: molybdate ABC transporter substrate-binding protein [Bacteroidota bacterium]